MSAKAFAREQVHQLEASGWNECASIRDGLKRVHLPAPTPAYLAKAFTPEHWARAHRATLAMNERFRGARFLDEANIGVVLVPDPKKLDTRGAVDAAIRRDQVEDAKDFVDPRLPAGPLRIASGRDWTLVVTIAGAAGIALGSYDAIRARPAADFTVDGVDTRTLMIRQVWGARVLQMGSEPPDSNARATWTFTLFPGEKPVDGDVASGTVLHGRVRFRLGRADRGISSARVCPAVVVV
ncbi:hypothetical protein LVJ94_13865 [Pendulispora rubella]|uniref:Uncharacterized protein n=1 Tax=Pendulispora rubella TaxID=2741070 RepID=A0ABZ2LBM3_9BACT